MASEHGISSICRTSDWNNLSDQEIIHLNTYDLMAYLGKRVIHPGGVQGRDQVLDRLKLAPGDRVLEIGGGSGHTACHIARKYRCHITSIATSEQSVHKAARRISQEGLDRRVRVELGDVNSLAFDDGAFDAVVCQAVMMRANQERALAEVRRVLKKGGVFSGLEFSWKKDPPQGVREKTHDIYGCKTLNFHSRAGWLEKMRHAGFIRVKSEEHPFGLLSVRGFLRDEGLANSMQIAGRMLSCKASMIRMSEIWSHFSRNIDYFGYVVFSGEKMQDT